MGTSGVILQVVLVATTSLPPVSTEGVATESPTVAALRFFASLPEDIETAMRLVRPSPLASGERLRILATLPTEGELAPDDVERRKLSALEPVLAFHQRHGVLEIKVIDLPQAAVALYERVALLVSRPALRLLSAAELRAAIAHEIGHEFFWSEYEDAHIARNVTARQTLELKCDGIAALTLLALGFDVAHLDSSMRRVNDFNKALGVIIDTHGYPTVRERQTFLRALVKTTRARR